MEPSAMSNESLEAVISRVRDEVDRLAASARIAFAARCGTILIHVFRKAVPDASKSDIEAMRVARDLAKTVAAKTYSGMDISTDGSNLRNPVLEIADKQCPGSYAQEAASAVASVAETVKFSEIAVSVAVDTVRVLHSSDLDTGDKKKITELLLDDLQKLLARSTAENWKYSTPVSQGHFSQVQLGGEVI